MKLYMFRTVPLSIIRSHSLYTEMVYVIQDCRQLSSSSIRIEYQGIQDLIKMREIQNDIFVQFSFLLKSLKIRYKNASRKQSFILRNFNPSCTV
jgi:hypothetical protein